MTCLCLSCHFRTLLPFTCVDDSCLSVMHAGHDLEFRGLSLVRLALSAFTPATASSFFFDLTLCLVVSGHASTQTCAEGSTGLHVWWRLLTSLSHVWQRFIGCRSRLFFVSLFVCTLFSRGALHLALLCAPKLLRKYFPRLEKSNSNHVNN